jgi:hypothetical protein
MAYRLQYKVIIPLGSIGYNSGNIQTARLTILELIMGLTFPAWCVRDSISSIRKTNWRGKSEYPLMLSMQMLGSEAFETGLYIGDALREEETLLKQLLGDDIMDVATNIAEDYREVLAEITPELTNAIYVYVMPAAKLIGVDVGSKRSIERASKQNMSDDELQSMLGHACISGVAISLTHPEFTREYDHVNNQKLAEIPSSRLFKDNTAPNLRDALAWATALPSTELEVGLVSILEKFPVDWREDAISVSSDSLMEKLYTSARKSADKIPIVALTVASSTAAGSGAREYIKSVPFLYDLFVPDDPIQADRLILVWSVFILSQTHPAQVEAFGKLPTDSIFPEFPEFGRHLAAGVIKQIEKDMEIGDGEDGTLWSRWTLYHWLIVYALSPDLVDVPTMPIGPGAEEALGTRYPNLNQLSELGKILDKLCGVLPSGITNIENYLHKTN